MSSKCLNDAEIVAYVDGSVDERLRSKVEEHISRCPLCLHSVAELKQLVELGSETPSKAPARAISRAEQIVRSHICATPELSVVASIRKGLCRVLETTGSILPPARLAPIPTRGEKQPDLNPRIAKTLSGYLVTVELLSQKDGVRADLTLVEESSRETPDGVKVKLYARGTCETRYTHDGKVQFSVLEKGLFDIELEDIGRIRLEIQ